MTVRMLSDAALRRRIGRCRELDELVSNRYERNATRLHDFYQMIAAGEIFDDPDVGWREWKLGRHGHWMQTIDDMKTTYLGELKRRRFRSLDDMQLSALCARREGEATGLMDNDADLLSSAEVDAYAEVSDLDLAIELSRRADLSADDAIAEYKERLSRSG